LTRDHETHSFSGQKWNSVGGEGKGEEKKWWIMTFWKPKEKKGKSGRTEHSSAKPLQEKRGEHAWVMSFVRAEKGGRRKGKKKGFSPT